MPSTQQVLLFAQCKDSGWLPHKVSTLLAALTESETEAAAWGAGGRPALEAALPSMGKSSAWLRCFWGATRFSGAAEDPVIQGGGQSWIFGQ